MSDSVQKRNNIGNWVVGLILAGMIAAVIFLWSEESIDARGKRFPNLSLQPLMGNSQTVTLDDLVGKVVLINFWGTWCGPCRLELPQIVQIYETYKDDGNFLLLSVSCGRGREVIDSLRKSTESMLKKDGIDMPTYADTDYATRGAIADAVGFNAYPTTFVLDREGVIRGEWVGYHPDAETEMEQLISKLLEVKLEKSEDTE